MGGRRGEPDIAPLAASHVAAARALLAGERPAELLDRALGGTRECIAIAATRDARLLGVALYGEVAGSAATGALLWLVVEPGARRAGVGRALLEAAVARLREGATRLVVAELADDESHAAALALLVAGGFEREGAVPDFYRDGVPLTLWTRRLA